MFNHKKPDIKELDLVIEYLKTHKKVECNPYPVYESEVMKAFGMLDVDRDYLKNYEKISNKHIEEMDKKEIETMLTFIVRGERFCDGHIAGFVESGDLLKLMLRLRDICF